MSEWINVEDRLPDKPGRYLVVINPIFDAISYVDVVSFADRLSKLPEFDYYQRCHPNENYNRPGWWDWRIDGAYEAFIVTHWMPLPELPKEE